MIKNSLVFFAEISSWLQHTEFFVQNGPWVFLEAEIFWVFWALSFFETGKKRACIKVCQQATDEVWYFYTKEITLQG